MSKYVGLVQGKVHDRREMSEYYCGGCGYPVTDHDSYCRECGGALHRAPNQPISQSDAPKPAENAENCATKCEIRDFDDSREKLEADVHSHFWHNDWCRTEMVIGWLDRQEAITAREYCWADDALQEELDRVRDERDHLRRHVDMLNAQVIELTAERDEYRERFGKALDLAHEIGRLAE